MATGYTRKSAKPEDRARAYEIIKQIRKTQGMTNEDIADTIGYSRSAITSVSPGTKSQNPSAELIRRILLLGEDLEIPAATKGKKNGDSDAPVIPEDSDSQHGKIELSEDDDTPPEPTFGRSTLDHLDRIKSRLEWARSAIADALNDDNTKRLLIPGLKDLDREIVNLKDWVTYD